MLKSIWESCKERSITGRWTNYEHVFGLILAQPFDVNVLGESVEGRKICGVTIGNGPKRVLAWSQMHGNEPTATSTLFDLINYFQTPEAARYLKEFTIVLVPMLNPDGAEKWTRQNAQGIDLNRDAVDLKAPESRYLRILRDYLKPYLCFNLHDQRGIWNVKGTDRPATISFLSPSVDEHRTVTPLRAETMTMIGEAYKTLQPVLNGYIARFTDEFYPNATGDVFQKDGYNTILMESGAHPADPERQFARMGNFISILSVLDYISECKKADVNLHIYNSIPHNDNKLADLLIVNLQVGNELKNAVFYYDNHPDESRTKALVYIRFLDFIENRDISKYFIKQTFDAGGKKFTGKLEKDGMFLPEYLEQVFLTKFCALQ